MASRCCKCMSSGVCIACSCVHQHRVCSNCYPSRVGCCRNLSHHSTTSQGSSRSSDGDDDSKDHVSLLPSVLNLPLSSQCSLLPLFLHLNLLWLLNCHRFSRYVAHTFIEIILQVMNVCN